jgi:hypothetical protein
MGTSEIWYYPSETGPVQMIALGERFTVMEESQERRLSWTTTLSGRRHAVDLGGTELIRVTLDRFDPTTTTRRSLEAVVNHLLRGGIIGLCLDADEGWAAGVLGSPAADDTTLSTDGGLYSWLPGTPAADTIVVVQSGYPDWRRESRVISSVSGDTLTLTSGLLFDYAGSPVIVRERDTWIGLRLAEGARQETLLTWGEGGVVATLDLPLVVDWGAIADQVAASGALRGESGESGETFEQISDTAGSLLRRL